jgi:hypothetical protein
MLGKLTVTHIDLQLFKNKIQNLFNPMFWKPTDVELQKLANEFNEKLPEYYDAAFKIFYQQFPDLEYLTLDGLESSDDHALLAIAMASAKSTEK